MDYKIKFEYKGIGKQASAKRQQALQAQRSASEKKSSISQPSVNRELLTSIKGLNASIKQLITSINKGGMGRGGGGGGGGIGRGFGGGAGIGGIGASIPIAGAAIALAGFTIQKINQIGSAYIERTGMQKGSAGIGGFRRGQGMYNASEMGAGMRSFAGTSGKFSNGVRPDKAALDIGGIYGMSASDVLGQAGTFKRAGANYSGTAYQGAGMGIQSELPVLMTGIAGVLEEAIKNGINTSDMSKDIGREISNLAMNTPGRSVDAAMNMIQSFKSVKSMTERGKMGESLEGMYTAGATKEMLSKNIGQSGYLERLTSSGMISEKQKKALSGLGPNAKYEDIQRAIGATGAHTLFKNAAQEAGPDKLMMNTMRNIQKQYGTGAEGFQMFSTIADQLGFSDNQSQRLSKWKSAQGNIMDVSGKGKAMLGGMSETLLSGDVGQGVLKERRHENMIFDYGSKFADTSIKMEVAMLKLAEKAAPAAISALAGLEKASIKVSSMFNTLDAIMSKKGSGMSKLKALYDAM
jgi:hypothetical protein